nr:hypothetical protein [Ktedonobacter racemifer]
MVALSFGREIEVRKELEEALATYAVAVMEKVMRQGSRVRRVSVFIQTNSWDRHTAQYANEASAKLPYASSFTPDVLDLALALLGTIYAPGYRYKRAGVYVTELSSQEVFQRDLFGMVTQEAYARQAQVMDLVDSINEQWGRETFELWVAGGAKDLVYAAGAAVKALYH